MPTPFIVGVFEPSARVVAGVAREYQSRERGRVVKGAMLDIPLPLTVRSTVEETVPSSPTQLAHDGGHVFAKPWFHLAPRANNPARFITTIWRAQTTACAPAVH